VRTLERLIENPISDKILEGEFSKGDQIIIDAKDGQICFTKSQMSSGLYAVPPKAAR
jgi:ATP-dependent Clp protease ATP-binding subunit ClpA